MRDRSLDELLLDLVVVDELLLDLVVVWLGGLGPHVDPAPVCGDDHVLLEVGQAVVEAVLDVEIGRVSGNY